MKMVRISTAIAGITAALIATHSFAATFEITAAVQSELDKQKFALATWAADPVIVNAVKDQNAKGPIAGMDNLTWKSTRRTDSMVETFQNNDAGQWLTAKAVATQGWVTEVFLSAAAGEKVAFMEKTSSYIHKGNPKFDVPFTSGTTWQGKVEFDESSQTFAIQVSVPVNADDKAIGVLVAGINLSQLQKLTK